MNFRRTNYFWKLISEFYLETKEHWAESAASGPAWWNAGLLERASLVEGRWAEMEIGNRLLHIAQQKRTKGSL
jgi:hypothetical protein